jgi:hypothetical protein
VGGLAFAGQHVDDMGCGRTAYACVAAFGVVAVGNARCGKQLCTVVVDGQALRVTRDIERGSRAGHQVKERAATYANVGCAALARGSSWQLA